MLYELQDVINAIIKDNPDTVYTLPCTWNVQITNRATFEKHCYDTNSAKVGLMSVQSIIIIWVIKYEALPC